MRRAHGSYWGVDTDKKKPAMLLLAILLAQATGIAKVIEDSRYRFRVDLPGIVSDRIDQSDAKTGPLVWRAYTSSSPNGQRDAYTASIKVFETDSSDTRVLFEAGESDASQSLGATLIGRRDGTFGAAGLPSRTLTFQNGRDGAADMLRATVLLVVNGKRLYVLTFSFTGGTDQTPLARKLFASFEILK
jgi:hypothetical protein